MGSAVFTRRSILGLALVSLFVKKFALQFGDKNSVNEPTTVTWIYRGSDESKKTYIQSYQNDQFQAFINSYTDSGLCKRTLIDFDGGRLVSYKFPDSKTLKKFMNELLDFKLTSSGQRQELGITIEKIFS